MTAPKPPWLRLAVCASISSGLIAGSVALTRRPPMYEVHAAALERGIDTNALFYTVIE
jgi:hypothetical protein